MYEDLLCLRFHKVDKFYDKISGKFTIVFVYVIVWEAVVFGINSASNAGKKIVIVRGAAEHYYNFSYLHCEHY